MLLPVAWERRTDAVSDFESTSACDSSIVDMSMGQTAIQSRSLSCAKRPVRVAFLTPTLLMGGAERWMISLARRCDSTRIVWTGTALSEGAPAQPELCKEMSAFMPVFAGPAAGPPGENASVVRCGSTREAVSRACQNADLLVTWGLPHLGCLLNGFDIPVVFVSHGAGEWTTRAVRSSEMACSHFVAVSETALLPFSFQARARATVLHNGIDVQRCTPTQPRDVTRRLLGFDDQDILLGYVGRFSFEKNPLAAAFAARKLGGPYHAVYCGEGWKKKEVIDGATRIAGRQVKFIDHQWHVGNILSALDVFILASPAEGFSLSLAEAWYVGVPTVATRVGAVAELERTYGKLVSAVSINSSPGSLAQGVLHSLSDSFRCEVVPRAQSMVAEHFTTGSMARRWMDYIESIFNGSLRKPC